MRWVFAVSLVVGLLALIAWAIRQGLDRKQAAAFFDIRGPRIIAAAVAFGMGGLSAAYAGWNLALATGAAVIAAALAGWYAATKNSSGDQDRG